MWDERGEEQLVDENGTQVMMAWERPYMVRCIDALQITESDSVLEVGFGCGYSADRIQAARPRQHTIIECAEPVLVRLRAWAAERPSVRALRRLELSFVHSLSPVEGKEYASD